MAIQTKTVFTGDYAWQSWSNGYGITLTLTQESMDIAANRSRIGYLFTISNTDNNRVYSDDYSWEITIGGQRIPISHFDFSLRENYTTQTIVSGQVTVQHTADGTLDMAYEVSIPNVQQWNSYGPPAIQLSGTWALSPIPRLAVLDTAPNFTDEDNPVITYTNPAGEAASVLQAYICSEDGMQVYVPCRDIPKTAGSYTFFLSDTEREMLRHGASSANTLPVQFVLVTSVGEVIKERRLLRTMSVVNADPVLSASVADANEQTVALTGDSGTLVRFYSDAVATAQNDGQKGAVITGYSVANGGKTGNSNPYAFDGVTDGDFLFSAVDSRGNQTSVTVQLPMVEYVKLTCNLGNNNLGNNKPDTDGNMAISVSGNCYSGSFGVCSNTLSVYYRYKTGGGSYGDWVEMTPTISGNVYCAEAILTGLDYQTAYTFQAKAVDRLAEVFSGTYTARALPVFDWGEHDFNVNGMFKIQNIPLTDYVVGQGTDGIWTYRIYASGIAECWGKIADPYAVGQMPNHGFPFSFANEPAGNITAYTGLGCPFCACQPVYVTDETAVTGFSLDAYFWGLADNTGNGWTVKEQTPDRLQADVHFIGNIAVPAEPDYTVYYNSENGDLSVIGKGVSYNEQTGACMLPEELLQ